MPRPRVLTVFLAKAEQATVRYSSYLNLQDLNQMGIWQWLDELRKTQNQPQLSADDLQTALAGAMWMITLSARSTWCTPSAAALRRRRSRPRP